MAPKPTVLVVHPPLVSSAAPPAWPALAAGWLGAAGARVLVYDANLDFLCNYLLTPAGQAGHMQEAQRRLARGELTGLTGSLGRLAARLTRQAPDWEQGILRTPRVLDALRGQDFFHPAFMAPALDSLAEGLDLASLALHPLRLYTQGLHHPGLRGWDDLAAFAQEGFRNPFRHLMTRLRDRAAQAQLLLICLSDSCQLLAGLTLARAVAEELPGLAAAFWGPGLAGLGAPPADWPEAARWLPGRDPSGLPGLLGLEPPQDAAPAYDDFDQDYLAPGLVHELPMGYPAGRLDSLGASRLLAPLARWDEVSGQGLASLGLGLTLGQAQERGRLEEMAAQGLKMLIWSVRPGDGPKELGLALKTARRAGLWNHLLLPPGGDETAEAWAAAHPHLANSLARRLGPAPGPGGTPPPAQPDLGPPPGLPPLSGWPVARWLAHPAHLLLYLERHGPDKVRRWRLGPNGQPWIMGENITYTFGPPAEADEKSKDAAVELILSAGRVPDRYLRSNMEAGFLFVTAVEEGVLVGTETIKHPRQEYVDKVRRLTGFDLSGYLERGYIAVRPEYWGLGVGDALISGCMARIGKRKSFIVVPVENKIGFGLTHRHGSRVVTSYYSELLGKEIEILVPEGQER